MVRLAREVLRAGEARLIRLSDPEHLGGHAQEGVQEEPLTCVSGGTLEIFMEPHVPAPNLVVVGHFPVCEALASLGKNMGYRVTALSPEFDEPVVAADVTATHLDFSKLDLSGETYIVVASHGNYDEEALESALKQTSCDYVALVSSPKRARAVRQDLEHSGVSAEQMERLKVPAGLDIGAVSPEEIAISILAEIVQCRRSIAKEPGPEATSTAKDPVCGMMVAIASARYTHEHGGQNYYFCASGCQRAFQRQPDDFLVSSQKTC